MTKHPTMSRPRVWGEVTSLSLLTVLVVACVQEGRNHLTKEADTGDHLPPLGIFGAGDGWGSVPGYSLSWVSRINGTVGWWGGNLIWGTSFAANGDLLTCGRVYSDLVSFGPGTDNEIAFDSVEQGKLFLSRFDMNGTPIWVSTIRTSMFEIFDIFVLDDGSTVVSGRLLFNTNSPADLPLPMFGVGEPGETSLDACTEDCPFIAKYRADGTFDWVTHAIGGKFGGFTSVSIAPNNDICTFGTFLNSLVFEDGTPDGATLQGTGGAYNNGFLARFDSGGRFLWARLVTNLAGPFSIGGTALPDGSCALLARHLGNSRVDTGYFKPVLVDAEGYWSLLVAKYLENGDLAWVNDLGIEGTSTSYSGFPPRGIKAIEYDIVVGSEFSGALRAGTEDVPLHVSTGENGLDMGLFVARLNGEDGSRLWTATATGVTEPEGKIDALNSVEITVDGRVIVGGGFSGVKQFGAGEDNETILISKGASMDSFIAAYSGNGSFLWASRIVTAMKDYSSTADLGAFVTSITADHNGSLVAAGGFMGVTTFGTESGDALLIVAPDFEEAFLLRLDPDDSQPPD